MLEVRNLNICYSYLQKIQPVKVSNTAFYFSFLINAMFQKNLTDLACTVHKLKDRLLALGKKTHLWSQPKFFKVDVMTPANLKFWIRMSEEHNTCKDGAGIHIGKKTSMRRMP